ncbi:MAG TPA: DEAD/DEAH box helicase [Gemmataceae bacterium]|nr:DEAD/DEAH box helicase [Gemmataceae bacterium]
MGNCTGTLPDSEVRLPAPAIKPIALASLLAAERHPSFERALQVSVRPFRVLHSPPWVRSLGKLALDVTTEGWRFPVPREADNGGVAREGQRGAAAVSEARPFPGAASGAKKRTRLRPPADAVVLKERLLYLLQPPLENLFAGKQVRLPFQPYPYQVEGIAFLMPRYGALLADEMGLGKTVQSILALRLLFQAGLIQRALLVCPKPLVHNWSRELRTWADDLPFEIIGGDTEVRRTGWLVSNCPLKLVNYELLTRDADYLADERMRFDVVILDEAQRIKNRESKTSRAVRRLQRSRSWALTGTPVENRSEDLINLFAFVDPDRIPADTPPKRLPQLTADCILRRTKEQVLGDLPAKTVRDTCLELTPAQRAAYALAESEGVVRLNALGETITVQHVFELVLRLKQICNFDPLTRASAKLEQLQADLAEVAASGRKAIVFSQWVEPLRCLASALADFGPLEFHGQVPMRARQVVLERFQKDRTKHVILMSYGTGSVGLNLQCANYVFLFDRWWNPAVEDQAINRVHRIGQKEPVFVTRFIAAGTIEERIAEVLEKKRQLFYELIDQNEAPSSLGLTEEEIFGLFNIQPRPRRTAEVSAR